MSSLKRGRDMDNQAWYAVLRHRRGNPDTRFAVTYPYCCTLSTLPADDTLALDAARGLERFLAKPNTSAGVASGEPGFAQLEVRCERAGVFRGARASDINRIDEVAAVKC